MLKRVWFVLAALGLVVSGPVVAKGERYGATVGVFGIAGNDYPQGKSGTANVFKIGLTHSRPIDENNNRWRWWFGLNFLQSGLPAPAGGVYQEVRNVELQVVPQFALADMGWLTPYVGAGVSLGYSQYSDRWKVDPEGYKYDALEDKSDFEFGGIVSIGTVIKLGSNPDAHLQLIPQASYLVPLNNGLSGYELSVTLLF